MGALPEESVFTGLDWGGRNLSMDRDGLGLSAVTERGCDTSECG